MRIHEPKFGIFRDENDKHVENTYTPESGSWSAGRSVGWGGDEVTLMAP